MQWRGSAAEMAYMQKTGAELLLEQQFDDGIERADGGVGNAGDEAESRQWTGSSVRLRSTQRLGQG